MKSKKIFQSLSLLLERRSVEGGGSLGAYLHLLTHHRDGCSRASPASWGWRG